MIETALAPETDSIFEPGKNCWRTSSIDQATLLIDCADFYRAIHEAMSKAQHSIFIVGWEIDSECRLLRGVDAEKTDLPVTAVDLLARKATENPDLKIYLLRWDSSVSFIGERDLMPESAWTRKTPENLHCWLDDTIPIGGSHHQKIVIIDDELAFTGGMDIARQRWDERSHRIREPDRKDVLGRYGPYHDVQIMVTGPVVQELAELVRWRWQQATGYQATPIRQTKSETTVQSWPTRFTPFLKNMECALSRTLPWTGKLSGVQEIKQMYLDLISRAEKFIYIENQFMTFQEVAYALNRRLKECPELKILFVGSYNPKGIFEAEGMWAGRLAFKSIVEDGIDRQRVRMVYSCIRDSHQRLYCKRIHSKVLIIDDRFLTIGSANLDNRSMELDTECDFTLRAQTDEQFRWISHVRNDLIAEHTGRSIEAVAELLTLSAPLDAYLNSEGKGCYTLHEVDDSKFIHQKLHPVIKVFADPKEALVSTSFSPFKNPKRQTLILGLLSFIVLLITGLTFLHEPFAWFNAENVTLFLQSFQASPWAFFLVCLVYVAGGFIFFPVTVLSLLTAAVFGTLWGPVYAMSGALVSSALMFWIGHIAGLKILRRFLGERVRKIDHAFQKAGIPAVAALRLLPIAPFSLVNLAAGISSVRFFNFMAGTFLGLLPGLIAKGIVGSFLIQAFLHPNLKSTLYLALGILFWLVLAIASYWMASHWRKKRESL